MIKKVEMFTVSSYLFKNNKMKNVFLCFCGLLHPVFKWCTKCRATFPYTVLIKLTHFIVNAQETEVKQGFFFQVIVQKDTKIEQNKFVETYTKTLF